MAILLRDADIQKLLEEKKPLPANFRQQLSTKPKHGHKEGELAVKGVDGSEFHLIIRQSDTNPLDFSVILAYTLPRINKSIILCRYNGKHEDTNRLERQTFYDFHIHKITERYQDSSFKGETFADSTDRYSDLDGAIECLIIDCGFILPFEPQGKLF